jgi:tRNA G18 (ribose-2'-O)-methylase SpoU
MPTIVRVGRIDDARLVEYRDLGDPELVRRRGLFIAEGRLVVQRLIEHPALSVRSVLVSEAARQALAPALERLPDRVPVYVCDARDFAGLTGYNVHRGCLALAERPAPRPLDVLLDGAQLVLALEAITNADNVGGAFRNAAAFGVDAVLLSPTCCDPLYRKAIRTSMAATLQVPFARADDRPTVFGTLRARGFTVVALTPREPAEDLDRAAASRNWPDRLALVAGTEGAGLSDEVETLADRRVRIPVSSGVDSLNVAVAVGIALYAMRRV